MNKEKIIQLSNLLTEIEEGKASRPHVKDIEGFSGEKIISCLCGLTDFFCREGSVYLEIGVFRGFTLLSNACANKNTPCYGIDNFSLFDEDGKNESRIREHIARSGIVNAEVINRDFEEALDALETHIGKKKVGVFFIDGPHDYRSQLISLLKIIPYLARECIIIVDDSNYAHVRQANNDFLKTHPDFALLAEAYTPAHIANMDTAEKEQAIAGWWNGVNIIVRDPEKILKRHFAQEHKKDAYASSHDVFRHEFADIAFDILNLAQTLADSDANADTEIVQKIRSAIREHRQKNSKLFRHQNTYSAALPRFVLHV